MMVWVVHNEFADSGSYAVFTDKMAAVAYADTMAGDIIHCPFNREPCPCIRVTVSVKED